MAQQPAVTHHATNLVPNFDWYKVGTLADSFDFRLQLFNSKYHNYGGGGGSRSIFPQGKLFKVNDLCELQKSKKSKMPSECTKSVQKSCFLFKKSRFGTNHPMNSRFFRFVQNRYTSSKFDDALRRILTGD